MAMKLLSGTLTGATRVKDSQGMSQNLSKVLALGTTYRLFFPLTTDELGKKDIVIAAVAGRKLDYDKLGRSFVALSEFEQTDTGRIIDKSGLAVYSRIARVLHKASAAWDKTKAERDAKEEAEAMGKEINTVALNKRLNEIELEYFGDRDAKPQAVYATVSPMISGVVIEVATEVLVVPLNSNKEPEWGKATMASVPISNRKSKQLTTLLNNPDYVVADANYLEVDYAYVGTNKQQAGMDANYQGVSAEVSLARKFPESWEANKSQLDRLATDPEVIAARNMSMASSTTAKEVVELFNKYMSKNQLVLLHLDYEDELVKDTAKDMLELNIAADAPSVQRRLVELVESLESEEDEDAEDDEDATSGEGAVEASKAKTISELQDAVDDIDELTGAVDDL